MLTVLRSRSGHIRISASSPTGQVASSPITYHGMATIEVMHSEGIGKLNWPSVSCSCSDLPGMDFPSTSILPTPTGAKASPLCPPQLPDPRGP